MPVIVASPQVVTIPATAEESTVSIGSRMSR